MGCRAFAILKNGGCPNFTKFRCDLWSLKRLAALNEQAGSTIFIVLSTAWTVTSQRGRYFPQLIIHKAR